MAARHNTADEEDIRKADEKAKLQRYLELDDLKKILKTAEGRRFIWRYLEVASIHKTTFTGNSETFFKEGMRNIGLMILADVMDASPESFIEMMIESKKGDQDG